MQYILEIRAGNQSKSSLGGWALNTDIDTTTHLKMDIFKAVKHIMTLEPRFWPCHSPAGAVGWCQGRLKGIICFFYLWELLECERLCSLGLSKTWKLHIFLSLVKVNNCLKYLELSLGSVCAGDRRQRGSELGVNQCFLTSVTAVPPTLQAGLFPAHVLRTRPWFSAKSFHFIILFHFISLWFGITSFVWLECCLLSPCRPELFFLRF